LEAARVCSGTVERVVVASSDKAYGSHDQLPYTEKAPLQGRFPYDVSKACADLLAFSYFHTYRVPVAVTRCGNLFGGGDLNFNRLVPGTIRAGLQGQRPVIRSDGSFVRDYFFVRDAVCAYLELAERLPGDDVVGQAFNFGNETPMSVLQVVEIVMRLLGTTYLEPDVRNEASHEIPGQFLDCSKARSLLGWRARFSVQEGLLETIKWYEAWLRNVVSPSPSLGRQMAAVAGSQHSESDPRGRSPLA
jgi:CDP-glucose 4,6-dehydratase